MRVFFIFCDFAFTFIYLKNVIHIDWTEIAIVAGFSFVAVRWGGDYVGDPEYGYPYKRLIFAINIAEPFWINPHLMPSVLPVGRRMGNPGPSKDSIEQEFDSDAPRHSTTLSQCRQNDIPPMQRHEPLTESRMAWQYIESSNHASLCHAFCALFVKKHSPNKLNRVYVYLSPLCVCVG